ncbi:MAG: sulfite exporter TauE/SafE family protein [Salaquimonas sp.]
MDDLTYNIVYIFIGFAMGGLLKGATGAGAPLIAIPLLSLFYSVPLAVTVFAMPNLISNLWQSWNNRKHLLPLKFVGLFAVAGMFGAGIGTFMLTAVSGDTLKLIAASAVFIYIGFRLAKPHWSLSFALASKIVLPVGTLAGVLQGAAGISAPVSITFLNAMKLERGQFIATISVLFLAMAFVQIPMMIHYGLMTKERFLWSCFAIIPLVAFMPIGAFLARHISREAFDKVILAVLGVLAVRLAYEGLV